MKLPKSILIKGKEWKIEYKWGLRSGSDLVDGLCDPNIRTIFIRRELLVCEKPAVFFHELVHAVLFEAHLSYNDGWVDGLIEEVICDSVSSALLENFKIRKRGSGL